MLCVFVAGDQISPFGGVPEKKGKWGEKVVNWGWWTDGRNVLNWTWSSLQEEEVVGRVHLLLQIRRRRCPWHDDGTKLFCPFAEGREFYVGRGFFFVYYQKEWNFMFAQIFFCLLRNGSNFPLYFLLNVHTQFLFFWVCLLLQEYHFEAKNRVFWRTKQLKSLWEIWFWCRWVKWIESRLETGACEMQSK